MVDWPDLADEPLSAGVEVFGIDVTYTPLVGAAVTVRGVFDRPSVEVQMQLSAVRDEVGLASYRPTFGVRLADLPNGVAEVGATLGPIGGSSYQVAEVLEDGQGGAALVLAKV